MPRKLLALILPVCLHFRVFLMNYFHFSLMHFISQIIIRRRLDFSTIAVNLNENNFGNVKINNIHSTFDFINVFTESPDDNLAPVIAFPDKLVQTYDGFEPL